jgi:hypothetical protein
LRIDRSSVACSHLRSVPADSAGAIGKLMADRFRKP